MESHLDSQLQALDNLDEDGIERMRQRRLSQLKAAASRRQASAACYVYITLSAWSTELVSLLALVVQEWLGRGHGEYREIPGEKDFFAEVKDEERVVCHFFRENWPCKVAAKSLSRPSLLKLCCQAPHCTGC